MNRIPVYLSALALLLVTVDLAAQQADSPRVAAPADQFGVYGTARRVVVEPAVGAPRLMQVWGLFVVRDPKSTVEAAEERGYLYFEVPDDPRAVLDDWTALRGIGDGDGERRVAADGSYLWLSGFMRAGARVRVRTPDEAPANPDPYEPGVTPSMVPTHLAPLALARLTKPLSTANYVRVDRVVLEPEVAPERIQIVGAFSMSRPDGSFDRVEQGYLYLSLPPDPQRRAYEWLSSRYDAGGMIPAVREEWNDWKAVSGEAAQRGTPSVVRFLIYQHLRSTLRVRPPGGTAQRTRPLHSCFDGRAVPGTYGHAVPSRPRPPRSPLMS